MDATPPTGASTPATRRRPRTAASAGESTGSGARTGAPAQEEIVDPASCAPDRSIVVDALRQIAPDPRWIPDDPGSAWVEVVGHALRCCEPPGPLVTHTVSARGDVALALADCTPEACRCAPTTRFDFVEPHYLGILPSGTTRVRLGATSLDVVLP